MEETETGKKTKSQGGPIFPQAVDLSEVPPGFEPGAAKEEEKKEAERKRLGAEAKRKAQEKQSAKGNTKEAKVARRKATEAQSRALSLERTKYMPLRVQRAVAKEAAREKEARGIAEKERDEGMGSFSLMDGNGRALGKMQMQYDSDEGVFLKVNSNNVSEEAFHSLLQRQAVSTDGHWDDGCTAWATIKKFETTAGSRDVKLTLSDDSVVMGQASVACKNTLCALYETHLGTQPMHV